MSTRLSYTRPELLSILTTRQCAVSRIKPEVWASLRTYCLLTRQPTRRGCRGGRRKSRCIRTYVGNRPRPQPLDQQQPRALTKIPRVKPDYELPRVLLSNARALTNKLDELIGVMELNNVDVAAITETWVTQSVPEQYLQISGYAVHL